MYYFATVGDSSGAPKAHFIIDSRSRRVWLSGKDDAYTGGVWICGVLYITLWHRRKKSTVKTRTTTAYVQRLSTYKAKTSPTRG